MADSSSPPDRAYAVTVSMECARGLAALWVFLFHVADMVKASCPWLAPIADHGHLGVPVFFAVSGYCIFTAAQRCIAQGQDSKVFLQRRLVRIFPTFWASILVVLVLPYALEAIAALKAGSVHWPAPRWMDYTLVDWVAVLALGKGLLDDARGGGAGYTLVNSVYWTLAIEVQFYLVLYAAVALRRWWLAFVGLVSVASLAVLLAGVPTWESFFLKYWPAFLCGVVLRLAYTADLHPRALFGRYEFPGSVGVLAALALVLALVTGGSRWTGFLETAASAAFALWALGGVENGWKGSAGRWRGWLLAPLLLLGQCSYSVYLLHGKLYQLPAMFVRQVVPEAHPLHLPAVVAGTILLCYGFYLAVERRYQKEAGRIGTRPAAPAQLAQGAPADAMLDETGMSVERDGAA